MRFLLHSSNKVARAAATSASASAAKAANNLSRRESAAAAAAAAVASSGSSSVTATKGVQKKQTELSWGQRCSPHCGCVVRFESSSDPSTGRISSAKYTAKSVVAVQGVDGTLRPQMTHRAARAGDNGSGVGVGRPLLTECKCTNLHALASAIVEYLPGRKMDAVRNSAEFDGFRSSESFRRTALASQGLPTTPAAGRCYDLVEEAFLAATRGYVPGPRRHSSESWNSPTDEEKRRAGDEVDIPFAPVVPAPARRDELDPLRYAKAARRRTYVAGAPRDNMPSYSIGGAASASSAAAMPAFHIADVGLIDKYDDELDEICREIEGGAPRRAAASEVDDYDDDDDDDGEAEMSAARNTALDDWVSHVDRLHNEMQDAEDEQGR